MRRWTRTCTRIYTCALAVVASATSTQEAAAQVTADRLTLGMRAGSYTMPSLLYWAADRQLQLTTAHPRPSTVIELEAGLHVHDRVALVVTAAHSFRALIELEGSYNCLPGFGCLGLPANPPHAFGDVPVSATLALVGARVHPLGTVWRVDPYLMIGAGPKWYRYAPDATSEGLLVPGNQTVFTVQRAVGATVAVARGLHVAMQYADYRADLEVALPLAYSHSRGEQIDSAWSFGVRWDIALSGGG